MAGSSTMMALKAQNESRLTEEKKTLERKRNLMTLILSHCIDHGYVDTAEKLQQEAGVSLSKFASADNIDLVNILQVRARLTLRHGAAAALSAAHPSDTCCLQSRRSSRPTTR